MTDPVVLTVDDFTIPDWAKPPTADGTLPSNCRSCRADILWVRTTNDKSAPINVDGTSHFATCPDADRWRKKR